MKGLVRQSLSGYVEQNIKYRIRSVAVKADCSMRLVINTLLADALGITAEDKYYEEPKATPVKRNKTQGKRNRQT
jgi:hypothetical protein